MARTGSPRPRWRSTRTRTRTSSRAPSACWGARRRARAGGTPSAATSSPQALDLAEKLSPGVQDAHRDSHHGRQLQDGRPAPPGGRRRTRSRRRGRSCWSGRRSRRRCERRRTRPRAARTGFTSGARDGTLGSPLLTAEMEYGFCPRRRRLEGVPHRSRSERSVVRFRVEFECVRSVQPRGARGAAVPEGHRYRRAARVPRGDGRDVAPGERRLGTQR